MIETVSDISPETFSRFDAVIDVRSPSEFAKDHLPGAINLPVLNDAERAEVGTIYKQESRFKARRIGATHVARNVARHLETALKDRPNTFSPLIYCWRGGMRSNAMATIFAQVGWRCGVLEGGYKTWRRAVVAALRDNSEPLRIILLDGQTGTAKSEVLRAAANTGLQTLDLEALARHRGSVFGGYGDDPHKVRKIAIEAASGVNRVLQYGSKKPVCHITGFGDSSVDFVLRFWIDDPTGGLTNIRGNVYLALWDAFQAEDISIPFPQREVRMLNDPLPVRVAPAGNDG